MKKTTFLQVIKDHWKFLLFTTIMGLIGGWFTGVYMMDTTTGEMAVQLQQQTEAMGGRMMALLIGALQTGLLYGFGLAAIGLYFSVKAGLWKPFTWNKQAVLVTLACTLAGGLLLYPGDSILFGASEFVRNQYAVKPGLAYFICSLTYGGVIEEVIMRLFLMSGILFFINRIFFKGRKNPGWVFCTVNVIVAILFALGHIPSTIAMTTLTPLLLIRCLLLNGAYGMVFGALYEKYGIGYAMLCHSGCHLVSKVLMMLLI